MSIKSIVKWAILPALAAIVWISAQSFYGAAKTTQLSYDVATTTLTSVLNIQDTSKLTSFEKINTMPYTDRVRNVVTADAGGDFNVVITRTARPTLGGKPLPLEDLTSVTVNRSGITTSSGETYPFEPGEYESMTSLAQTIFGLTSNCASRASDINALVTQLTNAGATQSVQGAYTVFKLGNIETVLDLKNYVYVAELTRQSGRLIKEVNFEYNYPGVKTGGDGGSGDGGGCPVLARITTKEEVKSSGNAPLLQVAIHDISNVTVTNR